VVRHPELRVVVAPLPPEATVIPLPSEDADDADIQAPASPTTPALRDGQLLPLADIGQLRLHVRRGDSAEIDPIAFLLTAEGVVRSDADMIFFGQPDHTSGAVALAADDSGATTALHVRPADIPTGVTEILLTAQLGPDPATSDAPALEVFDLAGGRTLGRLPLPEPNANGLLQLGALQLLDGRWQLLLQPNVLDMDLATLAKAAGVEVS
jgi:stress response protein SCP2